jgi:hypothetical protein
MSSSVGNTGKDGSCPEGESTHCSFLVLSVFRWGRRRVGDRAALDPIRAPQAMEELERGAKDSAWIMWPKGYTHFGDRRGHKFQLFYKTLSSQYLRGEFLSVKPGWVALWLSGQLTPPGCRTPALGQQ